jgi:hypothetical protein
VLEVHTHLRGCVGACSSAAPCRVVDPDSFIHTVAARRPSMHGAGCSSGCACDCCFGVGIWVGGWQGAWQMPWHQQAAMEKHDVISLLCFRSKQGLQVCSMRDEAGSGWFMSVLAIEAWDGPSAGVEPELCDGSAPSAVYAWSRVGGQQSAAPGMLPGQLTPEGGRAQNTNWHCSRVRGLVLFWFLATALGAHSLDVVSMCWRPLSCCNCVVMDRTAC